jgi:hypothetical protein
MTEPWQAYDHIHESPPKNKVKADRVAVAVVMGGIVFGLVQLMIKEVVVDTVDRLKRLKQNIRP